MTIQRALTAFMFVAAVSMPLLPSAYFGQSQAHAQEANPAAANPAAANPAAIQPKAAAVELPMTRAVLYSSGVAYFEHEATVTADGTATIPFKTDQINDILKSMVVVDESNKPASVTYPSNDPLNRSLSSFGINLAGDPSLSAIIGQLRGVSVTLMAPNAISGKVLAVDEKITVTGNPPVTVTDHIISVVTAEGIKSVPLSSVNSFTIADARLQDELNKALVLIASSRDTQRKPVEIHFKGEGTRKVRVGYLLEAPVWKSTYRLELSDKPLLQGWALVENTSDNDWTKVGLSLVSGRPISFRMDLYTPMYLQRPIVQPQYFQFLRPRLAEAGIESDTADKFNALSYSDTGVMGNALASGGASRSGRAGAKSGPAAAPAMMEMKSMNQVTGRQTQSQMAADSISGPMVTAADVTTEAGQMGELFKYTLPEPVTMPRQQSAMLALLSKPIKAQKVSVYNAAVLTGSPLSGVRLTNDSGMKLLTGPIAIFDGGSYAGDAQIDNMSENETRLLTYGVDLSVKVDSEVKSQQVVTEIKVIKGVLQITRKQTYTQDYKIKNSSDNERLIIIEHPRDPSRKLIEPAKEDEVSASYLRFSVKVPAGKTQTFTVKEEQPLMESVSLLHTDNTYLNYHLQNSKLSPKVKEALIKAMNLRNELTELERQNNLLAQEINAISSEQNRIRQNINTVGSGSPSGQRYVKKMSEQEDRIEAINTESKNRQVEITAKRKELEDYLKSLTID